VFVPDFEVSVPFRGIKNRKDRSWASRDDYGFWVFQSPFGELKIGKLNRISDYRELVEMFQSPFGELKIGKPKASAAFLKASAVFQSPFGELKIGKPA